MKKIALAALLALSAPLAAQADELTLNAPLSGGTIHTDLVDMSVYYTASDEAFEVVAYYLPRTEQEAPRQLRMRLTDGDRVVFGLPGLADATYSFAREGDALTVTAAPLQSQLAVN